MFGVFGMLALGVLVFCLRAISTDEAWGRAEKHIRRGYWGLNIGLALVVVLDLFPAGVLQSWDVLTHGYWHARRRSYLMSGTCQTLEWLRILADMVFLLLGAVPIAWATVQLVLGRKTKQAA